MTNLVDYRKKRKIIHSLFHFRSNMQCTRCHVSMETPGKLCAECRQKNAERQRVFREREKSKQEALEGSGEAKVEHKLSVIDRTSSSVKTTHECGSGMTQVLVTKKKLDDENTLITKQYLWAKKKQELIEEVQKDYLTHYNVSFRNYKWELFRNPDTFRYKQLHVLRYCDFFEDTYVSQTIEDLITHANRDSEGNKLQELKEQYEYEVDKVDKQALAKDIEYHQEIGRNHSIYRDRCLGELMSLAMLGGKKFLNLDVTFVEIKRTRRLKKELDTWREYVSSGLEDAGGLLNPFMVYVCFTHKSEDRQVKYTVPLVAWVVYHADAFMNDDFNDKIREAVHSEFKATCMNELPREFRPKHTDRLEKLSEKINEKYRLLKRKMKSEAERNVLMDEVQEVLFDYDDFHRMLDRNRRDIPMEVTENELRLIPQKKLYKLKSFLNGIHHQTRKVRHGKLMPPRPPVESDDDDDDDDNVRADFDPACIVGDDEDDISD